VGLVAATVILALGAGFLSRMDDWVQSVGRGG
jgi:hypothetical protein